MLTKFTQILIFGLSAFFVSFLLYPRYIKLLKKRKAGQSIRDSARSGGEASIFKELHAHKAGTPTMWWWLFLIVVGLMVVLSIILQQTWYINNSLFNREETYVILFALFSMWGLGLVDDVLNIRWNGKIKWLTAKMKLVWMFLFSWFISRWFYTKLGIDYINIWPFGGELQLGIFYPILTFFFTISITNAINIADGLDGLVAWLMLLVLAILGIMTFVSSWYLATTIIVIMIWCLLAFLWYNINPAKIFMWDAWALGLWWLTATLVYLLDINFWTIIPFVIMFSLFWLEIASSTLQMFWKKVFKKKLFLIAPFHHQLEKQWMPEHTIVMRFWLLQWVLVAIALIMFFYQIQG